MENNSININKAFGERIVISDRRIDIKGSANKVYKSYYYGSQNINLLADEIKSYLDENNFTNEKGESLSIEYITSGLRVVKFG